MKQLVRNNATEVQINLEKLSNLLKLDYAETLETLNQISKLDHRMEGYLIDWGTDGLHIIESGLILLLPFLNISKDDTTLFNLFTLMEKIERQECRVYNNETSRIKNVVYKKIIEDLEKKTTF